MSSWRKSHRPLKNLQNWSSSLETNLVKEAKDLEKWWKCPRPNKEATPLQPSNTYIVLSLKCIYVFTLFCELYIEVAFLGCRRQVKAIKLSNCRTQETLNYIDNNNKFRWIYFYSSYIVHLKTVTVEENWTLLSCGFNVKIKLYLKCLVVISVYNLFSVYIHICFLF